MTTHATESKISLPFLHFVGDCWLNGKAVMAYGDGETVQLRAETTGGRHIPTTRVEQMSADEYEALREQWTEGGALLRGDARIQQRALRHLGLNV